MTDLPDVHIGEAHPAAHNAERSAINALQDAVDDLSSLPAGGSTGQYLKKNSGTDGDAGWATLASGLLVPAGGSSGYVLKKASGTDGDTHWVAPGIPVPTGGSGAQVLRKASATDGDLEWATLTDSWRGLWTTDELLFADDMSSFNDDIWDLSNTGANIIDTSGNPDYAKCLYMHSGSNGDVSATLHLGLIDALAGKTLTQIKFWNCSQSLFSTPGYTFTDGANLRLSTNLTTITSWTEETETVGGINDEVWLFHAPGGGVYGELLLTGIRVYGVSAPYMLGQYVVYSGHIYESALDNNNSTPGDDGNWVLVL